MTTPASKHGSAPPKLEQQGAEYVAGEDPQGSDVMCGVAAAKQFRATKSIRDEMERDD